jgi:hypothetical protein
VRSGKVTTTVSETCPTSITPWSVFSLDPGYGIDKLRNEQNVTIRTKSFVYRLVPPLLSPTAAFGLAPAVAVIISA